MYAPLVETMVYLGLWMMMQIAMSNIDLESTTAVRLPDKKGAQ